jgi:hypothetical protein
LLLQRPLPSHPELEMGSEHPGEGRRRDGRAGGGLSEEARRRSESGESGSSTLGILRGELAAVGSELERMLRWCG